MKSTGFLLAPVKVGQFLKIKKHVFCFSRCHVRKSTVLQVFSESPSILGKSFIFSTIV